MPALELLFTRGEYARRLAKVRRAMAERDIDVLFVEDPSNMSWLTGYDGWSFYVHQGISSIICVPGSIAQAHKADEFIAVGQLAACLEMLDKLRLKLVTTAGSA